MQLKFHQGLVVPSGGCTRIRVGGTAAREWSESSPLLFDDSFEHEVWNDCQSLRAVFQLVLVHPLAPPAHQDTVPVTPREL
jgi:hypothetical protein